MAKKRGMLDSAAENAQYFSLGYPGDELINSSAQDTGPTYHAAVDLSTGTLIEVAALSATSSETMLAPLTGPAPPNFWVSEGPVTGTSQINGAIEAIAVHPTDPNILYVGSVNGGVWKTTNATAA